MEQVTPKSLGFRFPAEWEPHIATWLTYPQNPYSWPNNLDEVCKTFDRFISIISKVEIVHVNINDIETQNSVEVKLDKLNCAMEKVQFHLFKSDDCWCRDHGPAFLINTKGEKVIVDWEFNAWGNKYPAENDNKIPGQISQLTGYKRYIPGIFIEGGSIEVNGNGTLLTTKACLLNKSRNPHLSITEIEEYLRQYYCIDQVLWLDEGIAGDDTDGHIDDIARFADRDKLIVAVEYKKESINYLPLKKNLLKAKQFVFPDDTRPEIIELPMPDAQYLNGDILPASYANFYICNAGVIAPVFGCNQDQEALKILENAFPGKEIIPLNARTMIQGLGSWHCLTQQEPF